MAVGIGQVALALGVDVLADDLDQVVGRVVQVQRRPGQLQAQRIAQKAALEHFLADRGEDLDVVVDGVQIARGERYPDLREVPVAAIDRALLLAVDEIGGEEVLEILVDVVDIHGDRAVDPPKHRQQMRHIVLERREIGVTRQGQEIGEQIAGAAQVLVAHHLLQRPGQGRAHARCFSTASVSAIDHRAFQ